MAGLEVIPDSKPRWGLVRRIWTRASFSIATMSHAACHAILFVPMLIHVCALFHWILQAWLSLHFPLGHSEVMFQGEMWEHRCPFSLVEHRWIDLSVLPKARKPGPRPFSKLGVFRARSKLRRPEAGRIELSNFTF